MSGRAQDEGFASSYDNIALPPGAFYPGAFSLAQCFRIGEKLPQAGHYTRLSLAEPALMNLIGHEAEKRSEDKGVRKFFLHYTNLHHSNFTFTSQLQTSIVIPAIGMDLREPQLLNITTYPTEKARTSKTNVARPPKFEALSAQLRGPLSDISNGKKVNTAAPVRRTSRTRRSYSHGTGRTSPGRAEHGSMTPTPVPLQSNFDPPASLRGRKCISSYLSHPEKSLKGARVRDAGRDLYSYNKDPYRPPTVALDHAFYMSRPDRARTRSFKNLNAGSDVLRSDELLAAKYGSVRFVEKGTRPMSGKELMNLLDPTLNFSSLEKKINDLVFAGYKIDETDMDVEVFEQDVDAGDLPEDDKENQPHSEGQFDYEDDNNLDDFSEQDDVDDSSPAVDDDEFDARQGSELHDPVFDPLDDGSRVPVDTSIIGSDAQFADYNVYGGLPTPRASPLPECEHSSCELEQAAGRDGIEQDDVAYSGEPSDHTRGTIREQDPAEVEEVVFQGRLSRTERLTREQEPVEDDSEDDGIEVPAELDGSQKQAESVERESEFTIIRCGTEIGFRADDFGRAEPSDAESSEPADRNGSEGQPLARSLLVPRSPSSLALLPEVQINDAESKEVDNLDPLYGHDMDTADDSIDTMDHFETAELPVNEIGTGSVLKFGLSGPLIRLAGRTTDMQRLNVPQPELSAPSQVHVLEMPTETILHMLSYMASGSLGLAEVQKVRRVCKSFHGLINNRSNLPLLVSWPQVILGIKFGRLISTASCDISKVDFLETLAEYVNRRGLWNTKDPYILSIHVMMDIFMRHGHEISGPTRARVWNDFWKLGYNIWQVHIQHHQSFQKLRCQNWIKCEASPDFISRLNGIQLEPYGITNEKLEDWYAKLTETPGGYLTGPRPVVIGPIHWKDPLKMPEFPLTGLYSFDVTLTSGPLCQDFKTHYKPPIVPDAPKQLAHLLGIPELPTKFEAFGKLFENGYAFAWCVRRRIAFDKLRHVLTVTDSKALTHLEKAIIIENLFLY